jgi:predicted transcriptional regulator
MTSANKTAKKSATLPSLRVEPELRAAAESVLEEGETLSAFVENSVRKQVEMRRTQTEFIARGLKAAEESRRTGIYYTTEDVLSMMRRKLEKARAAQEK